MENRYQRQQLVSQIGALGQEKIQQATLLVVGCGALGSYTCEQLVRTGVKKIILIDPDIVELTNLQRQTLFTEEDCQQKVLKVVAAKKALMKINRQVEISSLPLTFEAALFQGLDLPDLVLDCTDNFLVRQSINEYCLHFNLPFIFAACGGTSGQVMALHPSQGPCLQCVFPHLKALLKKDCETIGVMTSIVPLISSLQVSLALQYLVTPQTISWETFYQVDAWPLNQSAFTLKKNPSCLACSQKEDFFYPLPTIEKNCGDVYYVNLSPQLTPVFSDFAKTIGTLKESPLALQVKLDGQELTFFKTGRLLFYHFVTERAVMKFLQAFFHFQKGGSHL